MLALKESHSWWHKVGTIGSLWEAALAAGWNNAEDAEQWTEVVAGPYGTRRAQRAPVATTDPQRLPRLGTWYLTTNLPAPSDRCEQETKSDLAPASVHRLLERGSRRQMLVDRLMWYVSMRFREALAE